MDNSLSQLCFIGILLLCCIIFLISSLVWADRYQALQKQCIDNGYGSWELDQGHYPPVSIFKLKDKNNIY